MVKVIKQQHLDEYTNEKNIQMTKVVEQICLTLSGMGKLSGRMGTPVGYCHGLQFFES